MTDHSVRRHLDLEIEAYDETIRRWIPGYEMMLEQAASAVAAVNPERALDLGGGTGALSAAILARTVGTTIELVDIDPEMIAQAEQRLAGEDRMEFVRASFEQALCAAPAPGLAYRCDAIAASLALHHIPTIEDKTRLFQHAFAALSPGGVLVNGDCTMPSEATSVGREKRQMLFRYWADHQVANGVSEEDAWGHFGSWSEEDTYLPLEEELEALRSVGFSAARVWNAGPIGVVVATKPANR